MAGSKKVPACFYRNASGAEPVRDWLLDLSKGDRKAIGTDIATVEYGWPVGMLRTHRWVEDCTKCVRTSVGTGSLAFCSASVAAASYSCTDS